MPILMIRMIYVLGINNGSMGYCMKSRKRDLKLKHTIIQCKEQKKKGIKRIIKTIKSLSIN
jgi:hypothetical protein